MKAKLTHEEAVALVQEWDNPTSAAANSEYSRGAILRALERPPTEDPPSAEEVEAHNHFLLEEVANLRRLNKKLEGKLAKAHERVEDLVEASYEGAHDAITAFGAIPPSPRLRDDTRMHSEESALWIMTDWQGAKKTTTYNSDVLVARVMDCAKKNIHITEIQRKDHPVRKCTIGFGGDMIEGLFQFPHQAFEIDQTLYGQVVTVGALLARVVRFALENYDEVEVVAEWGNHGRIGHRNAGIPRPDNFDRMCYELARAYLGDQPRLKWEDSAEDIQRIEMGEYRAILIHGDEIGRNGYASVNTIVQHINRWRSGALPEMASRWADPLRDSSDFRDCYINHYHTHYQYALANGIGDVYGTGSTESDNRYASIVLAVTGQPSQRLHFIDTKRGRVTAQYKVFLVDDIGLTA